MNRIIILLLCISILGIAAAQTKDASNIQVEKPLAYQYTDSRCFEYQMKMLYLSTDTSQSYEDMQKEYLASQAYKELSSQGQLC